MQRRVWLQIGQRYSSTVMRDGDIIATTGAYTGASRSVKFLEVFGGRGVLATYPRHERRYIRRILKYHSSIPEASVGVVETNKEYKKYR